MSVQKQVVRVISAGLILFFVLMVGSVSTLSAAEKAGAGAVKAEKKMEKPATSKTVLAVQQALNKGGYALKEDGRMGPKTRKALMDFQKKNGLKATGKADKATVDKLGIK